MTRSWANRTVVVLNGSLGLLFAWVALGPIRELLLNQPTFGFRATLEAAFIFSSASAAFLFGAWVLARSWPQGWRWQVVPTLAAAGMILLLATGN